MKREKALEKIAAAYKGKEPLIIRITHQCGYPYHYIYEIYNGKWEYKGEKLLDTYRGNFQEIYKELVLNCKKQATKKENKK